MFVRLLILFTLSATARAQSADFAKDIRPLFERYCFECHGGDKIKGDIRLNTATADAVQADPKTWRNILTQIADRTMPPARKPQPSEAERQTLIDFLTHRLDNLDLSKLPKDPGRPTLRRLNRVEYNNTIRDLLGVDTKPADTFPADGGGGAGFDNNADTLFVPPVLMEMYLKAAGDLLSAADPARYIAVKPSKEIPRETAAKQSIERFVTKAFRRPITNDELTRFTQLFAKFDAKRDYTQSLRLVAKAILVSPHFLFRVEKDRTSKEPWSIDDFELAARLSYFIWASMPDDELFKLAADGKLHDDAILEQQVRRMIKESKSKSLAEQFGGQWLGFNLLKTTANPDRRKFPEYTPALRESFYDQSVEFVDSIFREDRPITTLLASDYTFVNETLAKHYALPDKIKGQNQQRISLKDPARGGVLGLGAIHVVTSYPLRTSPVLRGKWVLDTLLGAPPAPPPPDVPALPEDESGKPVTLSLREKLEKHRSDARCASCHNRMDPLGFGLENFDAIGRFRTSDNNKPIDTIGQLTTGQKFNGPVELQSVLMSKKDDFTRTMAEKMLAYALGRGLESYDLVAIKQITDATAKDEYKSTAMIVAVAKSYPFRYRR